MCAMYHNTDNWQEFRGAYLNSRRGGSEIKNLISITPGGVRKREATGNFLHQFESQFEGASFALILRYICHSIINGGIFHSYSNLNDIPLSLSHKLCLVRNRHVFSCNKGTLALICTKERVISMTVLAHLSVFKYKGVLDK